LEVQVGVPPVHASVPVLQGFDAGHAEPSTHVMHAPVEEQTSFIPQLVPGWSVPVSLQTGAPVEQSIFAVLQAALGGQVASWLQATHVPMPSHTWFMPQDVPAALFVDSTHEAITPSHFCAPSLQGLVTMHGAPSVHATQAPATPQIWSVAQAPQSSVLPQPSSGVPQAAPRSTQVFGVQPHRFAWPLPPHDFGAVQRPMPHTRKPPHPSVMMPQSALFAAHEVGVHAPSPHWFAPAAPQVWPVAQVPQITTSPQPSESAPQFALSWVQVFGAQLPVPHWLGTPTPPQVCPVGQAPQVMVAPQPSKVVPHPTPRSAQLFGVQLP
jgi:hypothetical protein